MKKEKRTIKDLLRNPVAGLILALLLAVVCSLLGLLLSEETRLFIADSILTPIGTAFIQLVNCIALPMIFVSVMVGFGDMGDAKTLGKTNARLLLRFFGLALFTSLVTAALGCLVYRVLPVFGGSGLTGGFGDVFRMLLGIIPSSLFTPFTSGNTLQIIFLAVLFGVALFCLQSKVQGLLTGLRELNEVFLKLMSFIGKLIPVYVFLSVVRLSFTHQLSAYKGVGLFLLIAVGIALLFGVFVILKTALKFRVSPLLLLRKVFGVFFLAFTTASSAVSFQKSMEVSEKDLGVEKEVVRFGSPLALVFCKPMSAVYLVIISIYFANVFGIVVTIPWLLRLILLSVVLTAAIPPVSAGGVNCYVVLFGSLGIPDAALTLALSIDPLVEFLITGFNVLSQPLELLCAAGDGKQVDLAVLGDTKEEGQ